MYYIYRLSGNKRVGTRTIGLCYILKCTQLKNTQLFFVKMTTTADKYGIVEL